MDYQDAIKNGYRIEIIFIYISSQELLSLSNRSYPSLFVLYFFLNSLWSSLIFVFENKLLVIKSISTWFFLIRSLPFFAWKKAFSSIYLTSFGFFRISGYFVSGFSIGFGPALIKKDYKGVTYSIRALPLGGFVAFPDDDDENIRIRI